MISEETKNKSEIMFNLAINAMLTSTDQSIAAELDTFMRRSTWKHKRIIVLYTFNLEAKNYKSNSIAYIHLTGKAIYCTPTLIPGVAFNMMYSHVMAVLNSIISK